MFKIAVLPGDGIGVEVTTAALPIFEALEIPVELHYGDIGWLHWKTEGEPIPERTWRLISEVDSVLLGAITSKPKREAQQELPKKLQAQNRDYISPIIQLRQKLDLFANIRPCFSVTEEKQFNFCIIRENTEGLYSGFDYYPAPASIINLLQEKKTWQSIPADELSCALRLQSRNGLQRLFAFAFDYAAKHAITRVTFADKPNVLRQSSEFARALFETVASNYPQINADILNVDAVALWMIRKPEEFGVIVAENMFGDILSDVGAGIMGGLGFAPSANIGLKGSYFEPVHGSGPRMANNSANPTAMFFTISMLLEHLGFKLQASTIINAVARVIQEGRILTYDLGGRNSTAEMAAEIIKHSAKKQAEPSLNSFLIKDNKLPEPQDTHSIMQQIEALKKFSTSELSDALDSCGVEGALLHIKPLLSGTKIVGPAYTVQYTPYEEKPPSFKNAANYIDTVQAHSIIVIDNNGRPDCTVWGEILSQVALNKNITGTIVHGAVRDLEAINALDYPLFSSSIYMRSGKNRVYKNKEQCPLLINNVTINPGDIVCADDNGVLVIPQNLITDILTKVQNIRATENKIKAAIKSGESLEQARADFHYDRPWLDDKK